MTGIVTSRDRASPAPFSPKSFCRHGIQRVPLSRIVTWAAEAYGIAPMEILSARRQDKLVRARALAVWGMRNLCDRPSYPRVGRALGGRDHGTVINLHEKAIHLRLCDRFFAQACVDMTREFEWKGRQFHVCN